MKTAHTLFVSTVAATLVACGTAQPPKELVDARAAYTKASTGVAAQQSPAEVHVAKTSLDAAEKHFTDDGDTPETKGLAYIAQRKAQLAEASARTALALKEKQAAELEAQKFGTEALKELQHTKAALNKSKEELEKERLARAEAEKKAAAALADLQKIAAVKQESRGTVITLSGGVLFKTGESALLPAAMVTMNQVAEALTKNNPDAKIVVEGHTDSQGKPDDNKKLSQKRAESVADYLVSRGVAKDRVTAVGQGQDRPVADNKSNEGRAQNRRVEIIVGGS